MIELARLLGQSIGAIFVVSLVLVLFFAVEWALIKALVWFISDTRRDVAKLQNRSGEGDS